MDVVLGMNVETELMGTRCWKEQKVKLKAGRNLRVVHVNVDVHK